MLISTPLGASFLAVGGAGVHVPIMAAAAAADLYFVAVTVSAYLLPVAVVVVVVVTASTVMLYQTVIVFVIFTAGLGVHTEVASVGVKWCAPFMAPDYVVIKAAPVVAAADILQGNAAVHMGAAILEGARDVLVVAVVVLAAVVAQKFRDARVGFA